MNTRGAHGDIQGAEDPTVLTFHYAKLLSGTSVEVLIDTASMLKCASFAQ